MSKKRWIPYPRYIFRKKAALSLIDRYVPKGASFLEIGCASGDFGISLAKKGHSGLMIDFSDEALEEVARGVKEEGITGVRFENKDFLEIGEDDKFDLITMFEVMEHIEDDKGALRKINELLNEGGALLCSVPARARLWGASDVLVGHVKRYEKKELISLLEKSGFEVVKFFSYGFPWLNIIRIVRDRMSVKALEKKEDKGRISLTKKSGLNVIAIKTPLFRLLSNKYTLFLPMQISRLFNNMDLAEGYLCLAVKKSDKYMGSFDGG